MLFIDNDGTIFIYQGDSGEIVVNGLNENTSYKVYFSIQDEKRNQIGEELQISASDTSMVTFVLSSAYTDNLTVPLNKPYKIYYYGIKVCIEGDSTEDTLFIANSSYGDLNKIIVYPRKVKGTANGSV